MLFIGGMGVEIVMYYTPMLLLGIKLNEANRSVIIRHSGTPGNILIES